MARKTENEEPEPLAVSSDAAGSGRAEQRAASVGAPYSVERDPVQETS